MKIAFVGMIGAASLVASADAGFAGFVAFSRNVGANTVIDVFAAVTNANDKFLNVYNLQTNGTFVQKPGLSNKTWKPDAANFTSTRSVSDDSFMTAGTFSGGSYGGEYYASTNTNGNPNFTGTSWNATPASPAATTIPNNAGWYTGDPTSVDNGAELMSAWAGSFMRTDSRAVNDFSRTSAGAAYGVWIAHLVLPGNNRIIDRDAGVSFRASAVVRSGTTSGTDPVTYEFYTPAPSAFALLIIASAAGARRQRSVFRSASFE
jgi:hypothetical protein